MPGVDRSCMQLWLFLKHWVRAVLILKSAFGLSTTNIVSPVILQLVALEKVTVSVGTNLPRAGYWYTGLACVLVPPLPKFQAKDVAVKPASKVTLNNKVLPKQTFCVAVMILQF